MVYFMKNKLRPSVQAIVYRENAKGEKEFLILYRVKNWNGWEFPKGGIKKDEKEEDAIIRELKEECNIENNDIIRIWKTHNNVIINYPEDMQKKTGYEGSIYKLFIVNVSGKTNCKIPENSIEHKNLKWIPEKDAKKYLMKELLEDMNAAIKILSSYDNVYDYGQHIKKGYSTILAN